MAGTGCTTGGSGTSGTVIFTGGALAEQLFVLPSQNSCESRVEPGVAVATLVIELFAAASALMLAVTWKVTEVPAGSPAICAASAVPVALVMVAFVQFTVQVNTPFSRPLGRLSTTATACSIGPLALLPTTIWYVTAAPRVA